MNIDGINIYTKTMITCDEDLAGQIYVDREELKVWSIGHCAMLEEDPIERTTGHGSCLERHTNKNKEKYGILQGRSDRLQNSMVSGEQRSIEDPWRNTNNTLNLGDRNLWMSFLVVENLDESDQFVLGRDFIRNSDVTIDLNNAIFGIQNPEKN